ncbi:NifB/NifX family molybdenum-iron cluster-binding protein [Megasphaera sueciensis]|uniref:NifB/NifX family molybdenum-iron cluster-binding protein n=1 Tax=Megasphaera sueciensis TaxID=349094 RepID=UPI003CFC2020
MKIAVTYENGSVFQHFGHTEQFKIYTIENNVITASQILGTDGAGHESLAAWLKQTGVTTLICGGIGGGAQQALTAAGIIWYGGVTGSADDAVNALLKGSLSYDPNARCSHHNHDKQDNHPHHCGHHQ